MEHCRRVRDESHSRRWDGEQAPADSNCRHRRFLQPDPPPGPQFGGQRRLGSVDEPQGKCESRCLLRASRPGPPTILSNPGVRDERCGVDALPHERDDPGGDALDEPHGEHGLRGLVPLCRRPRERGERQCVAVHERPLPPGQGLPLGHRAVLQQPPRVGGGPLRERMDVQLQRVPHGEPGRVRHMDRRRRVPAHVPAQGDGKHVRLAARRAVKANQERRWHVHPVAQGWESRDVHVRGPAVVRDGQEREHAHPDVRLGTPVDRGGRLRQDDHLCLRRVGTDHPGVGPGGGLYAAEPDHSYRQLEQRPKRIQLEQPVRKHEDIQRPPYVLRLRLHGHDRRRHLEGAGVTWSTEQIVNLAASDPNALTCLDFTSHLASWWWSNVSDANFKVQVRYVKVGNQASFDYLDWIPVTVSTASRLVRYVYDGSGNLIQAVDANGTRTQQYWYASSKLSEMTDHTGGGRYAKFTYDGSSRATEIWLGSYNGAAQWKYKAYGIAYSTTTTRTITNARGYTTTLTLNSFGNPTQISGPSIGCGACDNSGNTSSYIWDGEMNRIKVTDGRGFASTTGLDFRSNVVCRIDPGGNASSTVWSEINTASAYVALLAAQTTFRGYTTAHAYDVKGNLVKLTNAKGDYLDYVYDASGFLNRSTDFRRYTTWHEYNANGYLTKMTNPLNEVTRYGYDAWGRVVTVTSPMGFVTTSEYDKDDRLTKTIDSLGKFTSSLYNDRGDLIRTTDKNGNSTTYQVNATNGNVQVRTDALGNSTSSGFDLRGNRLTVTDANGHVTRYEYDVYDRLTKVTSPQGAIDGFFTSYVCDAAGNNIRRTDANGASTLYTYDKLERLTVTRYPDASTATQTYDEDGNPVSVAGLGYARTMAYDELGRVASVTLNYGSFAKTTTYAHDANGNRLTMTDAEGGTTAYAFDATNRQWKITDPESRITSYVYDGDSRVTSVTDPNGVNTTTSYDAAGRQRNVTTKSSGSVVLEFFNYSYDKAGNRLMMKTNEGTWGYEYDGVHRLGREVKPSGFATTYVYDAVGNRIEKVAGNSEVTYSYDLDDRLTHSSLYIGGNLWIDTSYPDYDKNGNLLRKVEDLVFEGTTYTTNYVYDLESRLKEITYPNNSKCTFSYLSTGERIGESCSPTAYVGYDFYGGGGFEDVVAEYDATGVRQARYTQGPGVDEPVGVLRSGAYYAYHVDALGSVTRITDSTQGVVRSYRYTAFGEVDSESGTLANPYGFTGRERRDGFRSYLVDDRARMYDPSIGRFLQKDPAGMADGPNLYAYVGNNPVNRADPSGMRFQEGPDDPPPSYGGGGGAGGSSSISASEPSSYGWPLRCWMGAVFLGIGIGFGLLGVYGAYISPQMWSNILYYLFTSGTWTLFRAALSGNIWAWAQLIFSLSWWAFWTFIWSSIPWFAQAAFGVQLATWATPPRWVLALGGLSLNIALGIIGLKQAGCF